MFAHGSLRADAVSPSLRERSMARLYCWSSCSACCFFSLSRICKGSSSFFCARAGAARTASATVPKSSFFMVQHSLAFLEEVNMVAKAAQIAGNPCATGTSSWYKAGWHWPELSGMSLSHHTPPPAISTLPRHDWTREEVRDLFALPFPELIFRAAQVHRENFDPAEVQI